MRAVLAGHGIALDDWPPASILLLMVSVSRFLLMEEAFDRRDGHDETLALVERHITALEGPRRAPTRS